MPSPDPNCDPDTDSDPNTGPDGRSAPAGAGSALVGTRACRGRAGNPFRQPFGDTLALADSGRIDTERRADITASADQSAEQRRWRSAARPHLRADRSGCACDRPWSRCGVCRLLPSMT